jgi:hypothetical protein
VEDYCIPKASACLAGYPSLSIVADYTGICRFEGKYDGNYIKVSEILQRWVKELRDPSKITDDYVWFRIHSLIWP